MIDLNEEQITDAATELGLPEAFLEKELHAVNAVSIVAGIASVHGRAVFTGGTSLSTAHNLIERFSEDVDFKLIDAQGKGVPHKCVMQFCAEIEQELQASGYKQVDQTEIQAFNFVQLDFAYDAKFSHTGYLRQHLQIEVSGEGGIRRPLIRSAVQSLIRRKLNVGPDGFEFDCVDPIEIVSDKISSLTWRVLDGRIEKEPQAMRHLYDIWRLIETVKAQPARFRNLSGDTILADVKRRARTYTVNNGPFPYDYVADAVTRMMGDAQHESAFTDFVLPAVYGDKVTFADALKCLDEIIAILKS